MNETINCLFFLVLEINKQTQEIMTPILNVIVALYSLSIQFHSEYILSICFYNCTGNWFSLLTKSDAPQTNTHIHFRLTIDVIFACITLGGVRWWLNMLNEYQCSCKKCMGKFTDLVLISLFIVESTVIYCWLSPAFIIRLLLTVICRSYTYAFWALKTDNPKAFCRSSYTFSKYKLQCRLKILDNRILRYFLYFEVEWNLSIIPSTSPWKMVKPMCAMSNRNKHIWIDVKQVV